MAPDTLIMVILICVGVALGLAGIVYVGLAGLRLLKAARKAGIGSMDEVRIVLRKVDSIGPRLREVEKKQQVIAERLNHVSATASDLRYLKNEFDRATGHITHLKS
jgi:hypothetical protein